MPAQTNDDDPVVPGPGSVTNALKEKLLYDVCTTLKYLDNLDSGFSIMIRVPGSFHLNSDAEATPGLAEVNVAKLLMTCYINTEWLEKSKVYGPVAQVVQTFAEGVACTYLTKLKAVCLANGYALTTHVPPAEPGDDFPLVPQPESGHPCCYKIPGLRPGRLKVRLTELEDIEFERMEDDIDWKGVEKEAAVVEESLMAKLARIKYACPYCVDIESDRREFKGLPPLMSFGSRTDHIMKLIEFPDKHIPFIYHMITRERSGRWTECLEAEFDLSHDKANILSMALQDDAKDAQKVSIKDAKLDFDSDVKPDLDAKLSSDSDAKPDLDAKLSSDSDAKPDSDDKAEPKKVEVRYSYTWSAFVTIARIILTVLAYEFLCQKVFTGI